MSRGGLVLALVVAAFGAGCGREAGPVAPDAAPIAAEGAEPPLRIGTATCTGCHAAVATAFDRGPHARAATRVECEDCHGAGSAHADWAGSAPTARAGDARRGFAVQLVGSRRSDWRFRGDAVVAARIRALPDRSELVACARCHASAERIANGEPTGGEPLGETHRVAWIEEGLHHADGQPDRDPHPYVAFVQGAMHEAGVTCSDCHDPHATALVAQRDALCAECHAATRYDVAAHDRHPEPRPDCIACHASSPAPDGSARFDHAFRIPRPDVSGRVDAPDACRACHEDRDARWAADAIAAWFPGGANGTPHWATALHAGRTGLGDPGEALSIVARDRLQPAVVRASALALLARYPDPRDAPLVLDAARDDSELVRRAAALHLPNLASPHREHIAELLRADPVRAVREAAR